MNWKPKSLLVAIALILPLAAIAQQDADSTARAILAQMTLRQKVYELHGRGVVKFGVSILVRRKVRSVKAGGDRKLGIPPTTFLDGPRGVSLYKGATAFPVTMARGASWDLELEQRVGAAIATEILALGANYSGAVCMNLLRHPRWGRSQETYGEDPHHVGEMAVALTRGIQSLGVQACAKHFAVNSMENNRFGGDFLVDEKTLHEVYLPHFKKVIAAGAASVMSSYNRLNGEYCGHSRPLLTDILRQQWGFRGYVTSDWQHGLRDTKAGIQAGMNVEMPSGTHYSVRKIKRLIKENEVSMADIDTLVLPIIRTKLEFAAKRTEPQPDESVLACTEHRSLAREVAEQSAVLLKNEASALPLDLRTLRSIAVVGSLANSVETGDHGSSQVFATDVVTPLAGIRAYLKNAGTEVLNTTSADSIGAVCQRADAVVVVAGMTWEDEGEYIGRGGIRDSLDREKLNPIVKMKVLGRGGDRKHLNLHAHDIETIKAAAMVNGRVIAVLVAGSALMVEEWHGDVKAILQTFYNGVEGGHALARILFGDVNPSGRLPFTVSTDEAHLPPFPSFAARVEYGPYHGYTLLDKEAREPRYPFGFGLSYTTFSMERPVLNKEQFSEDDSITVTVRLKNVGMVEGAEVVQVYVSSPEDGAATPVKLLRAFQKVWLKPGEAQEITLPIPMRDLARYDVETASWKVQSGNYALLVGNSARDANAHRLAFTVRE